jgi:hypothetical protein
VVAGHKNGTQKFITLHNVVVAVIFRAEDADRLSPYYEINTTRLHGVLNQEKIIYIFEFY